MIEDYEQELTSTPGSGQAFTATGFGGQPYDLGAPGGTIATDPAVGEPLQAMYQVLENFNNLTSATIDFGHADDSAGANFAVLQTTGAVVLANLTKVNSPAKRLGNVIVPGQITKRWLMARITVTGTAPTLGKIRVWLQNGVDALPVNKGAL